MSAYICSIEHIAALAAFAASGFNGGSVIYEWVQNANSHGNQVINARFAAKKLLAENIRSVRARYPDSGDDLPGPILSLEELEKAVQDQAESYYFNEPNLQPIEYLKMCQSYEYQSCETEDYRTTLAAQQIRRIMSKAIDRLPGYESAGWGFQDDNADCHKPVAERAPRPILLSSLCK